MVVAFTTGSTLTNNPILGARTSHNASVVCALAPEQLSREKTVHILRNGSESVSQMQPPSQHHSVPAVGYFLEHLLGMKPLLCDKKERYGSIFRSNYLVSDMVHISDYKAIVEICRLSQVFKCNGSFMGAEIMFPGNGLSLDGAEHAEFRSVVSPAFSKSLFSIYYPLIQKRTTELWEKVANAFNVGDNQHVVLEPFFRKHYLDIVVELSTGLVMDGDQAERIHQLFDAVSNGMVTYSFGPLGKPAYEAKAELHEILRNVVLNCIKYDGNIINNLRNHGADLKSTEIQQMRSNGLNLLHVFIAMSDLSTEVNATHDDKVIEKLAYTLSGIWIGGHATAASTSSTSVLQLGFNPDLLHKLREEQVQIMAKNGNAREVTYDQVMREMPILESFINEILRLYPPVAGALRIATEDVQILGKFIPKDTLLRLCFYSAHRDESVYEDATEFKADRFAKQGKAATSLAFGAPGSAHFCVGYALAKMQLNCTFATMLREYDFNLHQSQSKEFRYFPEVKVKSGTVLSAFRRHT